MLAVMLVVGRCAVFVPHPVFRACVSASSRAAVVLPGELPSAARMMCATAAGPSACKMSAASRPATTTTAKVFAPGAAKEFSAACDRAVRRKGGLAADHALRTGLDRAASIGAIDICAHRACAIGKDMRLLTCPSCD